MEEMDKEREENDKGEGKDGEEERRTGIEVDGGSGFVKNEDLGLAEESTGKAEELRGGMREEEEGRRMTEIEK